MPETSRDRGRNLFGDNATAYEAFRPPYPDELYGHLASLCPLGADTSVFEVGPGTGQATRELLHRGVKSLIAIEPDEKMAGKLTESCPSDRLSLIISPFETADLSRQTFDLGIAAMSFHWVDEPLALAKAAALLKPGGWWAMWWTIFGNANDPDEFHSATRHVFARIRQHAPAISRSKPHHADIASRLAALKAEPRLENPAVEEFRWEYEMSPDQLRGLFSTFSSIITLPAGVREDALDELERISREEFGGKVRRRYTTRLFTARKTKLRD